MTALDANKDGSITLEECKAGFAKWFDSWNSDHTGSLTDQQLRAGIDQEFSPFRGGPPGPGRFGPPN